MLNKLFCSTLFLFSFASSVNATIVEIETSQGSIQVNLFDQATPNTVENFLQYIEEAHYTDTLIHRVVPDFIVQGGGFTFDGDFPLTKKQTNPSVINEPVYSNVEGTIAMAKVGSLPNSATNQWFFNLANNAGNLDLQNGGFTVFGQVIGDEGMEILAKIANINRCNTASLEDVPVILDDGQVCADVSSPGIENFVVVNQITIIDSSTATANDLSPTPNTLIEGDFGEDYNSDGSSGGNFLWLSLLIGLLLPLRKLAR